MQEPKRPEHRVLVRVIEEPIPAKPKQISPQAPDARKQIKLAERTTNAPSKPRGSLANGHTPAIEASFGFPVLDYIRYVQQRARARLIILDRGTGQPVGEIRRDRFYATDTIGKNMSLRAREVTRDLPADYRAGLLQQVRASGTRGPWRFLLVFPRSRQQDFEQALSSTLHAKGLDWDSVDKLQIRYLRDSKGLLALVELAYVNGRPVSVGTRTRLW